MNLKFLFVHNNYASNNSGEEHAAEGLAKLLEENGHIVEWYRRSSAEIVGSLSKNLKAFFTGIWNPFAVKKLIDKIEEFQPHIVQVQNVYPLISPAIFKVLKKMEIPVVMRCPNYRLFCPTGLHLDGQKEVCEKCLDRGRELNCIKKNCENNLSKSVGYAVRNFTARKFWGILKYPDAFIVQTDFQRQKFIKNGIPSEKLHVVPGLVPDIDINEAAIGTKVTFVGRSKAEKGILEFIEAARMLPDIEFCVAGEIHESLSGIEFKSSDNVEWLGFLDKNDLNNLYENSRIIVVPGKWYEGFPNVITRAMKFGKPVITSNLGAMASIIDHEENGLLVEPGDAEDLKEKIERLYPDTDRCQKFGQNGRRKANHNYSSQQVYNKLMDIYGVLNAV
ncbi:glycosyltransferase family 4 protein [Rhodohalobacter sulfatireducens]|uniref:Glycosyltransferase family 4 protein n=1 Tax=Rhodohalobacter sulfatireducens TaxID=2911366 RepID=A0ABS9KIW5_9BACT|nr:glycosyltransferase family 4 protein [Rhodohalobacter sulfatireducens]MCG2590795.1 glycosyltransferase family 4 protein [Rhodohalobacter sulfatireducens]